MLVCILFLTHMSLTCFRSKEEKQMEKNTFMNCINYIKHMGILYMIWIGLTFLSVGNFKKLIFLIACSK